MCPLLLRLRLEEMRKAVLLRGHQRIGLPRLPPFSSLNIWGQSQLTILILLSPILHQRPPLALILSPPLVLSPALRIPGLPGGGSKILIWLGAVIGVKVLYGFCRSKGKCTGIVSEADSRFVHESGGGQVHELGEYQGYNRLALLVVLHAFLIIFAFTDSSRLVECQILLSYKKVHCCFL